MSWLLAFVGFALLILLHEAGHFVAAKAVGMRVERFSLGLGPLIFGIKRGETTYGIAPIPLGGYVKITGMNPYELEPQPAGAAPRGGVLATLEGGNTPPKQLDPAMLARAYYRQPPWKRIVVILAGPLVNLLIAFVILAGIFLVYGYDNGPPDNFVASTAKGSPAAQLLRPNDQVLAVDGVRDRSLFPALTASHVCGEAPPAPGCRATTPVNLIIRRHGRVLTVTGYPRFDFTHQPHEMRLGFSYGDRILTQNPLQAAGNGAKEIGHVTSVTVSKIVGVFFSSADRKQVNSVVGGYEVTRQAFSFSTSTALYILGLISLSLAVVNLFPFLPLDGGHIFWAVAEKLRGRAIPFSVMERASVVGFALVLFIFFIGLSNDVTTLSNGGFHVR